MYFNFTNKAITGILTIVPENESSFDSEIANYNFSEKNSNMLKRVIGFDKHRIVKYESCVSDLVVKGFEFLFDSNIINKEHLSAIILLTNTPDYHFPPTSNIIQARLNLSNDVICLDINQGCAGFMIGLFQAFQLLDQANIKKVAVVTGEVISRRTNRRDRSFFPLVGDAASITIVERRVGSIVHQVIKNDGSRSGAIIIPAGGMRIPASEATKVVTEDGQGNFRNLEEIFMDGTSVYNFVIDDVPDVIRDVVSKGNLSLSDVDYYIFHQPNKFMVSKLRDKLGLPVSKVPEDLVVRFGNSGGSTIPLVLTTNFGDTLKSESKKMCLSGFGVGLVWSAALLDIGNLDFSINIEVDL